MSNSPIRVSINVYSSKMKLDSPEYQTDGEFLYVPRVGDSIILDKETVAVRIVDVMWGPARDGFYVPVHLDTEYH